MVSIASKVACGWLRLAYSQTFQWLCGYFFFLYTLAPSNFTLVFFLRVIVFWNSKSSKIHPRSPTSSLAHFLTPIYMIHQGFNLQQDVQLKMLTLKVAGNRIKSYFLSNVILNKWINCYVQIPCPYMLLVCQLFWKLTGVIYKPLHINSCHYHLNCCTIILKALHCGRTLPHKKIKSK